MSEFFHKFHKNASNPATICPVTVAMAAPLIPIFGIPHNPKISIGSRIILITAPVVWEIIV